MNTPHILLVGTGRFGRNHLRILKDFHDKGKILFVGAVVRDKKKAKEIAKEFDIKVFPSLTPALLKNVDGVDIVTPPETHFNLVKKSLEYTNVFVEKPLTETEKEALELNKRALSKGKTLMVGHIFRFHAVTEELVKLVAKREFPKHIRATFINPLETDQGREPSSEFLHFFDVIDFIWKKNATTVWNKKEGRVSVVSVRYDRGHDGHFTLGWKGKEKIRTLVLEFSDMTIEADYISNKIVVRKNKKNKTTTCPQKEDLIAKEIKLFLSCIAKGKRSKVDGITAARSISIAERAMLKIPQVPRVAVIGGGIFGTSIAAELGTFCEVSLFEKNVELLQEGSRINQFRHHYGYHYPRSDETVIDIQKSRKEFEKIFKKAITPDVPTYYGIAKEGSLVSAKEFAAFCKKHSLPFKKKYPPEELLSRKEMDFSVKVFEPSYFHSLLKKIATKRLKKLKSVNVHFHSIVTACTLREDGRKSITYIENDNTLKEGTFDFVINATYANINRLADWLEVPHCPIRVDLAEVLIVKLPIKPISLTVIDGPFATLMPTGYQHEFTLYHVKESIIDRYVPKNGLVRKQREVRSRREAILRESIKYFPILKDAEILESRIVHRGVQAHHEHDDSRVAELIEHGFGCWSVLSGKILSSVTMAKKIADTVKNSLKQGK